MSSHKLVDPSSEDTELAIDPKDIVDQFKVMVEELNSCVKIIDVRDNELSSLRSQLKEQQRQFAETEEMYNSATDIIKERDSEISSLQSKMLQLQGDYESTLAILEDRDEALEGLQSNASFERQSLRGQLETAVNSLTDLDGKYRMLQSRFEFFLDEQLLGSSLLPELSSITSQLSSLRSESTLEQSTLLHHVESLTNGYSRLSGAVNVLRDMLFDGSSERRTSALPPVDYLKSMVSSLTKDLTEAQVQNVRLMADIQCITEHRDALLLMLDEKDAQIMRAVHSKLDCALLLPWHNKRRTELQSASRLMQGQTQLLRRFDVIVQRMLEAQNNLQFAANSHLDFQKHASPRSVPDFENQMYQLSMKLSEATDQHQVLRESYKLTLESLVKEQQRVSAQVDRALADFQSPEALVAAVSAMLPMAP
jgi:hypothetical protein